MTIKEAILKIASQKSAFKTSDVLAFLHNQYSRQAVASHIHDLVNSKALVKFGNTRGAGYTLPQNVPLISKIIKTRFKNTGLEESRVFREVVQQAQFFSEVRENVLSILEYAFTEMFNNAIEHSHSSHIQIEFSALNEVIQFIVKDFGIGVFKSIMQKRKLDNELEAIQDLMKGKVTTAPQAHSGEGIFFTSKVADLFILESFGYRLRVDNTIPDIFIEEVKRGNRGTKVIFEISTKTERHLNEVFKEYQSDPDEPDFDKTSITVRLYTMGTVYISRSQARRILAGLDKFREIVFDFKRVPTIGQAFADEIFRVFHNKHPHIKLKVINTIEPVQYMIDRAKA